MLIKSVLLTVMLRHERFYELYGLQSPDSIKVTPPNRKLSSSLPLWITYGIERCHDLTALSGGGRKPAHLWTVPAGIQPDNHP